MKIVFYIDEYDSLPKAQIDYGDYDEIIEGDELEDLEQICREYGYEISDDLVITNFANEIVDDLYDDKLTDYSNFKSRLPHMKLSRKDPTIGKTITAFALVGVVGIMGFSIKHQLSKNIVEADIIPSQTVDTIAKEQEPAPTDKPIITQLIEKIDLPEEEEVAVSEKPQIEETVVESEKPVEVVETTPSPEPKKEEVKPTPTPQPSEEVKKEELELMTNETDGFHFSYQDRSKEASILNAKEYDDLFDKYARRYGLDKNLLAAIAAQESSGNHYSHLNGPGYGLMQIEYVHFGETLSAYNYETKTNDSITVTKESVSDLETNIKIGAIILRNELTRFNCNIPLAVAAYNLGSGNINTVLKNTSNRTGVSIDSMKNDPNGNVWTEGPERRNLGVGDPEYPAHVFSYLGTRQITVLNKDGQPVTVHLVNDKILENQK